MTTGVYGRFDWRDRLRLLVSGNIYVEINIKTDVAVMKCSSTSALSVLPPGYQP
jgi:hypothetical protein